MTYELDYDNFAGTGIEDVSLEQFVEVVEKLTDSMELDEEVDFKEEEGLATVQITYRDSDNYKYPFALQLTGEGSVMVVEPKWQGDEEDEKDLFWSILREYFDVAPSFY